jgi:hypothetical protein
MARFMRGLEIGSGEGGETTEEEEIYVEWQDEEERVSCETRNKEGGMGSEERDCLLIESEIYEQRIYISDRCAV